MIKIELDQQMRARGLTLNELSARAGVNVPNLSRLKNGKVRAIRFSTLDALCEVLDCQPGDILKYVED